MQRKWIHCNFADPREADERNEREAEAETIAHEPDRGTWGVNGDWPTVHGASKAQKQRRRSSESRFWANRR